MVVTEELTQMAMVLTEDLVEVLLEHLVGIIQMVVLELLVLELQDREIMEH